MWYWLNISSRDWAILNSLAKKRNYNILGWGSYVGQMRDVDIKTFKKEIVTHILQDVQRLNKHQTKRNKIYVHIRKFETKNREWNDQGELPHSYFQ